MADVLKPSVALLAKLGSIIVHVDEGASSKGHVFDWTAARILIGDPEVQEWLTGMGRMAFIPDTDYRLKR